MVALRTAPEFGIMAALLVFGALLIYFGWRGTLDAFALRASDLNPLYWLFRWRYRCRSVAVADRAFLRFLWSLLTLLWVATVVRTLVDAVAVGFSAVSRAP